MMKIEWYASLYTDELERVVIPGEMLEAALVNASKKLKLGTQAKAGLFVADNMPLEFDGKDLKIDDLWKRDQNRFTKGVVVNKARIQRTRFIAKDWSVIAEVVFDPGLFNQSQVCDVMRICGELIGIGTWRPKYGRFKAELVD